MGSTSIEFVDKTIRKLTCLENDELQVNFVNERVNKKNSICADLVAFEVKTNVLVVRMY